jgi:hypothetical protein
VTLLFPFFIAGFQLIRDKNWKNVVLSLILILAVAELVLLPWQIRNYRAFDAFIPTATNAGYNLRLGNNPTATGGVNITREFIPRDAHVALRSMNEVERDQYLFQLGVDYIISHPGHAALLALKKIVHLYYKDSKCITYGLKATYQSLPPYLLTALIWITEGYYFAIGLSFIVAVVLILRRKKLITPQILFLFATILYFTIVYLPFIAEGRFHTPLMPVFVAFAAAIPHFLTGKTPTQA